MEMELEYKALFGGLSGVDDARGTVRGWLSREEVDRQGDIMVATGARLDAYRANPVVLWMHDQSQPIGNAIDLQVVPGQGIEWEIEFFDEPNAQRIAALYRTKRLRGFSIHAAVLKREAAGRARRVTDWELREGSCVSVPAHPLTLTKHYQPGAVNPAIEYLLTLCGEDREALSDEERVAENLARFGGALEGLVNYHRHCLKVGAAFPGDLAALAEKAQPLLAELLPSLFPPEPNPVKADTDLAPSEPHPTVEAPFDEEKAELDILRRIAEMKADEAEDRAKRAEARLRQIEEAAQARRRAIGRTRR